MVFVFYNKILLRVLVFFVGALSAVCAWHYIALSAQKLGAGGVRDALAIISFLIAGWLVMLIAEVADNHYVRAFGALCYLLGALVSFHWIFRVDAPKLAELQGGAQRMQFAVLGFWLATGLAALLLVLLITRLFLDKLSYGRAPAPLAAEQHDAMLGERLPGQGEAVQPATLQPIPFDQSPFLSSNVSAGAVPPLVVPSPSARTPSPVRRLMGVGGAYAGSTFELRAGLLSIGRQDADILLANDDQVSRRHAQVEVSADGIATVSDLGSTNGTWVNGARVTEQALAPGDVIALGTTQFKVEE